MHYKGSWWRSYSALLSLRPGILNAKERHFKFWSYWNDRWFLFASSRFKSSLVHKLYKLLSLQIHQSIKFSLKLSLRYCNLFPFRFLPRQNNSFHFLNSGLSRRFEMDLRSEYRVLRTCLHHNAGFRNLKTDSFDWTYRDMKVKWHIYINLNC